MITVDLMYNTVEAIVPIETFDWAALFYSYVQVYKAANMRFLSPCSLTVLFHG